MLEKFFDDGHGHTSYVKVWVLLLVLLLISFVGPFLEIQAVTLITAFGIAVVKAFIVAKYFMHITMEKRFVTYIMVTLLVFMFLFFAGTAPDVMKHEGSGWEKPAWKAELTATHDGHGGHEADHH